MEYLIEFGYAGLFLASFLAATILPLSSEVILSLLLINGLNPTILVCVATLGNVLGAFVNYAMGAWGSIFFTRKVIKISDDEFFKAKQRFQKYGVTSLLFAWVPIIGDPLTLVAGVLRINILVFFVLVSLGKLIRYVIVCFTILSNI